MASDARHSNDCGRKNYIDCIRFGSQKNSTVSEFCGILGLHSVPGQCDHGSLVCIQRLSISLSSHQICKFQILIIDLNRPIPPESETESSQKKMMYGWEISVYQMHSQCTAHTVNLTCFFCAVIRVDIPSPSEYSSCHIFPTCVELLH